MTDSASVRDVLSRPFGRAVVIGVVVFTASLIGIASRMPGTLAVFWPANALLLGIMMRSPRSMTLPIWACAAVGYVAADVITGTTIVAALALNACNLVAVAAGCYALTMIGRQGQWLTRIPSLAKVVAILTVAALAAGVAGATANQFVRGEAWWDGFGSWFSGELLNYVALLPVVLTCPTRIRRDAALSAARAAWPAALLLAAMLTAMWFFGGFGSVAFTMPALVVAALMTNVFVTSLFIAMSTAWTLILTAEGHFGLQGSGSGPISLSLDIGLSLLAIGPLAVACVMQERERALAALRFAVSHDDLTGALRRGEFLELVEVSIQDARRRGFGTAMVMMDLDHFKKLNDNLGHGAGDAALIGFADHVRRHLDDHHLFGRLGGEEFALFLAVSDPDSVVAMAESIRIGQQQNASDQFEGFGPTVSIGIALSTDSSSGPTDLLDAADKALYEAKRRDRNRTVSVTLGA